MPINYCNKNEPKPVIELVDWTLWQRPRVTITHETDNVEYNITNSYSMLSAQRINGVATGYSQLRTRGIHAMHFSEWPWVPGKIRGIEVKLHLSRLARIMDLTVQLTLNGELIGENLANPYAEDIHVYGGKLIDWNINKPFDEIDVVNLGLLLDFQPHHAYPSSELVYLRNVQMRVSYFPYVIGGITIPNSTVLAHGIKKTNAISNLNIPSNSVNAHGIKKTNAISNFNIPNNLVNATSIKKAKVTGSLCANPCTCQTDPSLTSP